MQRAWSGIICSNNQVASEPFSKSKDHECQPRRHATLSKKIVIRLRRGGNPIAVLILRERVCPDNLPLSCMNHNDFARTCAPLAAKAHTRTGYLIWVYCSTGAVGGTVSKLAEYIEAMVEPTFKDFEEDSRPRRAFLAAVAAYHAIDRAAGDLGRKKALQICESSGGTHLRRSN